MRRAAIVVLATGSLAGCGAEHAPTVPTPPKTPAARTVHIGQLTARYTAAGPHAPAILLLHEIRGGPDQWDPLIPYLHRAGFATLAPKSGSSPLEHERLPDVRAALRWLRERSDRIGIVGASIGASTTALAMATVARSAKAAVALSPPDSADVWNLQARHRYHPHDVLFVSDAREAPSVDGMTDGAVRSKAMRSSEDGHGIELLSDEDVRAALLAWLKSRLRVSGA
jgi:pimeloyl-ACP methyl ester carboxylesterase